jgi:LysM repeat protein
MRVNQGSVLEWEKLGRLFGKRALLRGREWSIVIVLLLSNYLIFSALGGTVGDRGTIPLPTRIPKPTFTPILAPSPTVTFTATSSPTNMPVATTMPTVVRSHLVEAGETLSQIAERYGTTVEALARVNELEAPYIIYEGQVLILP